MCFCPKVEFNLGGLLHYAVAASVAKMFSLLSSTSVSIELYIYTLNTVASQVGISLIASFRTIIGTDPNYQCTKLLYCYLHLDA